MLVTLRRIKYTRPLSAERRDGDTCLWQHKQYFMKLYAEPFNFEKARKLFSELGETAFHINEPNDRDNERSLTLKIGGDDRFRLYEFHNAICFAVNGAVNNDEIDIKDGGRFPNKSLIWKVHSDQFLKFMDAIEKALMGQGDSMRCKVSSIKIRNKPPQLNNYPPLHHRIKISEILVRVF